MLEKISHRRWTEEEEQTLKKMFMLGRENGTPHKELWKSIAKILKRKPSEVQRKMTRMYYQDEDLRELKQNNWTREKILADLKQLYLDNQPIHKTALPEQLCFTILKACSPTKRNWFESIDHAIAEAILQVGYPRSEEGKLDYSSPLSNMQQALDYVRKQHKRRHSWSLDEMKQILISLHEADYPITLPFLTNHYDIYKGVLGVNRKLESFKDVIKKFIEEGAIKSYSDLICSIAPEYVDYYNKDLTRQKFSTEEIRVKKFLDRFKIPYAIPRFGRHKLPTSLENYPNFIPDFIIFDSAGEPIAVVEVFGSIGDRENADVNKLYDDKTKAKQEFWKSQNGMDFVEIHNYGGRCDLADREMFGAFNKYIGKQKPTDIESVITVSASRASQLVKEAGVAILYNPSDKKYTLKTAAQDIRFDSLFDLPKLTSKNPALKKILETIHYYTDNKKQEASPENISSGGIASFTPPAKDPYGDSNRHLPIKE